MKRAGKDGASAAEPLDDQEQAAVIRQLMKEAVSIGEGARNKFHIMFSAVAGIFCVCIMMTMYMPWQIDHQSALKEAVGVVKFGVANFSKVYLFVALLAAALCLVFWVYVFVARSVSNPWLFWLPGVNLLKLLLAIYIDRDAIALVKEAEEMKSRRYNYKKI